MRTLEAAVKEVPNDLVLIDHPDGFHIVKRGDRVVATDQRDDLARVAEFSLSCGDLVGKSVAWIGGGLCVGPRLFAVAGADQTIFEIEPALAEFTPIGAKFVPGDWRDTLNGKYDVIVYDLGGDVPRETLSGYLKPGGIILP